MTQTLRILLAVLGVSAILIAVSIIALGAQATAWTAERLYDAVTGYRSLSEPWPATMDSELRFYAALWGAYGMVLIAVARDFARRGGFVPALATIFFVGGVGRAISYVAVGPPHPAFTALMAIELILPPILFGLWFGTRRAPR